MLMSSLLLLLLLLLTVELLLFCFKPQPHNDLGGLSNSQANQPTNSAHSDYITERTSV